jgi:hypothetical protein
VAACPRQDRDQGTALGRPAQPARAESIADGFPRSEVVDASLALGRRSSGLHDTKYRVDKRAGLLLQRIAATEPLA